MTRTDRTTAGRAGEQGGSARIEPPRVCQVVSSFFPLIGGVQRATEQLCRELRDQGLVPIVVTRRYSGLSRYQDLDGVRIYRVGWPLPGKMGSLAFAVAATWHIAVRLWRYPIVHVQSIDTPLLIGIACRLLLGRRLVATIHGEAKILDKRRTTIGRARLRLSRRAVDVFTALTDEMRRELLAEGIPPDRIHVVPNGVETRLFRPPSLAERQHARARLGVPDTALVVLSMGRLVPGKRLDILLDAWSRHVSEAARRILLIVGDGPARESLERRSSELRLAGVRFEGETSDVLSYLHAADIFVTTSEREGLSLALLEAMACGVTVLVSDLPGNRAVVEDDVNGIVVPVGDVEALASRLKECLDRRNLTRQLSRNARRTIVEGYSLHSSSQQLRKLYENLDGSLTVRPRARGVGSGRAPLLSDPGQERAG